MTATGTHTVAAGFEQHYFALRSKEGRIYTDEEVLHLPGIRKGHPHFAEWQLRKESWDRLKHYFEKRVGLLKILEVGCGNGWLAHRLASIHGYDITATDINLAELQQAKKVFHHIPYLQFIYGGIEAGQIEEEGYDFIVFAASIQYFPSLNEMITRAFRKLKTNGEIHILDSHFYTATEIAAAKKSTRDYYTDLGFPTMSRYYFHHTLDELAPFRYKIMYRPGFINHHLLNNKNPFPWLCIKKVEA
jgi:ubiquinone/menaquinone biosynthesis C-methylase UbiE